MAKRTRSPAWTPPALLLTCCVASLSEPSVPVNGADVAGVPGADQATPAGPIGPVKVALGSAAPTTPLVIRTAGSASVMAAIWSLVLVAPAELLSVEWIQLFSGKPSGSGVLPTVTVT